MKKQLFCLVFLLSFFIPGVAADGVVPSGYLAFQNTSCTGSDLATSHFKTDSGQQYYYLENYSILAYVESFNLYPVRPASFSIDVHFMTLDNIIHLYNSENYTSLYTIFEPYEDQLFNFTIPVSGVYAFVFCDDYSKSGDTNGGISLKYWILGDAGAVQYNITQIIYNNNTQNTYNSVENNAYTTVHERAVATWADVGLIAMICAIVIGVVLLRRRR